MLRYLPRLPFVVAVLAATSLLATTPSLKAQQTESIVEENGIRYRVTKQITKRPIYETKVEQQQQTVYREQYNTQFQTSYRTYLVPITEYRMEPYVANRWNPFAAPYTAYRYVPVTRWETRQEPISVPIVRRDWVPQQQTVHIPRTTTTMVEDEVVSKIALGPATNSSGSGNTAIAQKPKVKLDGNPPGDWESAGGDTIRR